ncbi:MAG TPA: hypothetical protein VLA13_00245 [Massilibacterium sp.]|nr:hypothetical protein [Massilibacterium sp.]
MSQALITNGDTMKEGQEVITKGKQIGIIQILDEDLALVWFGGHQRNAKWCYVTELEAK